MGLWGRVVPKTVEFSLLGDWLNICRRHHTEPCDDSKQQRSLTKLNGFQLVDCERQMVVPATGTVKYSALSYVWGSPKSLDSKPNAENWPRVVRDAVLVTKTLGLGYLWVDKHCINQEDSKHKDEQIAMMDQIYERANVTIIAAAGQDAHAGLPGVGNIPSAENNQGPRLERSF